MEDWLWLALSIVIASVASSITYLYSLRVSKKGKLWDARFRLYGEYIGEYQEALGSIERIIELQELDLSEKALSDESCAVRSMMTLLSELSYAGDAEIVSLVSDPEVFVRAVNEKGECQFMENLRNRAILLHNEAILRHFANLRLKAGHLAFVTDTQVIADGIKKVNEVLAAGLGTMVANVANRFPELFTATDWGNELRKMGKNKEEWAKEVGVVLNALLTDMKAELQKTL